MLNWLLFWRMPFQAPFSIILMFWITLFCQGKISHCLEFLRFYQISIPHHLGATSYWHCQRHPKSPGLPSVFTILNPHHDSTAPPSPNFGLLGLLTLCNLWLVLHRPLRILLSASSTSSSWSLYSLDRSSPSKALKQVPSPLIQSTFLEWSYQSPQLQSSSIHWSFPYKEVLKQRNRGVGGRKKEKKKKRGPNSA